MIPDHTLWLLELRVEERNDLPAEGTGLEPDAPVRGRTPFSKRVSLHQRRYLPEHLSPRTLGKRIAARARQTDRPQWRESNPAFVRAHERTRRGVSAADHRFTGSTAVAAEGIEPSRRRVWAATVPSTSCGHCIAIWYRWRDLHPRSRFERPESWLLDDTDRTQRNHGQGIGRRRWLLNRCRRENQSPIPRAHLAESVYGSRHAMSCGRSLGSSSLTRQPAASLSPSPEPRYLRTVIVTDNRQPFGP